MRYDVEKNKAKKESGDFSWEDLSDYVQARTSKEKGVAVLKEGVWVLVGKTQVLLKKTGSDMDDAYALVVTRKHNSWLNWIVLPLAQLFDPGEWVVDWNICPKTNVLINAWYVGDGTGGVFLAAQTDPLVVSSLRIS